MTMNRQVKTRETADRNRLAFVPLAAGMVTAVLGFAALLGWLLGSPRLASLEKDLIPMAPSTAALFILFGIAICLRSRSPLTRALMSISRAAGCTGAMVAFVLLTLGCMGIHSTIEHLGLNIATPFGGALQGYMSPVTAFAFLLVSLSFLASLSPSTIRLWRGILALSSAGLLLGAGFIFLIAYLYSTPLLYGGTFIPPALNTVIAFVLLGVALLALAVWPAGQPDEAPEGGSKTALILLLLFILLLVGLVASGAVYFRHYERRFRTEVEQQLSVIAKMKVDELVDWRKERLADASIFYNNAAFSTLVRHLFENPGDTNAERSLQDWIGRCQAAYQYQSVFLTDAQGAVRLTAPESPPVEIPHLASSAAACLALGQIEFLDLHRHAPGSPIYMAILVPLFDELKDYQPLGVLVLVIDPTTYLYPFINRWPTPSPTAETLLVRRDGNAALYLNELRFMTNTALHLRIPLEHSNVTAVKAALGQEGIVEGIDYHGMPVIADVRHIPGSPWFIIARMDLAEVTKPLRERLWQMILFVVVLVLGTGAGLGLVWRRQNIVFLREQVRTAEALRESEARYRIMFESNHAVMLIIAPDSAAVIDANPAACAYYGWSREQLLKMKISDINTLTREEVDAEMKLALVEKRSHFIFKHRRSDGSVRDVEVYSCPLHIEGQARLFSIIHDITERKRMENELETLTVQLRELSTHLQSTREEERTHIAERIHDELWQMLTALKIDFSYVEDHMPPEGQALADKWATMKSMIDRAIHIVQNISMELHPSILDDVGLVPTIEWYIGEFQERSGIPCKLQVEPVDLSPGKDLSVALFRITQEALANVAWHSGARRIDIRLQQAGNQVGLVITHDGRALTPEQIQSPLTFGLLQIRERAMSHGGKAQFDSTPGRGTTLRVTIPMKQD